MKIITKKLIKKTFMPNLNDARKRKNKTQVFYDALSIPPEMINFGKNKTYFVKTYERVYIDSFGDNPTKYYTRDPYAYVQVKESDVYSASIIYYQEGYEAQVYPITGPGYENWNTSLDENLTHPFNTRIKDKYYVSKRGYEISQDKFGP